MEDEKELPQHVISKIISMTNCNLTVQSTSKEFNNIVSGDSKLLALCTINTFKNIGEAFKHAALHSKIHILDEILKMDKKIIRNSLYCLDYSNVIQDAIEYSNIQVLSYLLKDDPGFEYHYWSCLKKAMFFGNIEIIKIIILASHKFKYEQRHGNDMDQPPEYQYNGKKKIWTGGCSLIDIDILHNKIFIKSCIRGDIDIVKLFITMWSESLDYIKALEVARDFKRKDIIKLLKNKETIILSRLEDLTISTDVSNINLKHSLYSYKHCDESYYKHREIIESLILNNDDKKILEYIHMTSEALSCLDRGFYKQCIIYKKIRTADFIRNYILQQYKIL